MAWGAPLRLLPWPSLRAAFMNAETPAHGGHGAIPDEIVRCQALLIQINERPPQEH